MTLFLAHGVGTDRTERGTLSGFHHSVGLILHPHPFFYYVAVSVFAFFLSLSLSLYSHRCNGFKPFENSSKALWHFTLNTVKKHLWRISTLCIATGQLSSWRIHIHISPKTEISGFTCCLWFLLLTFFIWNSAMHIHSLTPFSPLHPWYWPLQKSSQFSCMLSHVLDVSDSFFQGDISIFP